MDLIDVVDAELAHGGGVVDSLAEGTDVVDRVVGSAVDFSDVEAAAFGDFLTDGLVGVEVGFGSALAVQGFGKDAGGGRFSRAARPDEKIGVGEPVLGDGVAQGADDVVLTEDVVKSLGAVFAGEDLVVHGPNGSRRQRLGKGEGQN